MYRHSNAGQTNKCNIMHTVIKYFALRSTGRTVDSEVEFGVLQAAKVTARQVKHSQLEARPYRVKVKSSTGELENISDPGSSRTIKSLPFSWGTE